MTVEEITKAIQLECELAHLRMREHQYQVPWCNDGMEHKQANTQEEETRMRKSQKLAWAIDWLGNHGLRVRDDMTVAEIIQWAESAQDNDLHARELGYDDIEDWAESTGHACINTEYMEPINPHLANR